jgi:hypothetical protein
MSNEEKYLQSKMGTKNPFTVPEGYFDTLTEQVMQRLPQQEESAGHEQQKRPVIVRMLRPLLYAAACLCIGIFGVGIYQHLDNQTAEGVPVISHVGTTVEYNDTYIEDATDYAMFDNQDIYATLLADM